jgi:Cu+-exporting ATPase
MGLLESLISAAVLFAGLFVWGRFTSRRAAPAESAQDTAQVRRIRVNEGYQPHEVHVDPNRPIRLLFRREETAPCSERVVFPDYGISCGLPPFKEVAVDLPASEPGAHSFCCGMNMLHGNLIVDPGEAHAAARTGEAVAA